MNYAIHEMGLDLRSKPGTPRLVPIRDLGSIVADSVDDAEKKAYRIYPRGRTYRATEITGEMKDG